MRRATPDRSSALAAAFALTAGFVLLAAASGVITAAAAHVANAPAGAWLGCLGALSAAMLLRFARLTVLSQGADWRSIFNVSALHGAATALLPGKLGEAVLPIAMKRVAGLGLVSGVSLLALIRIFDLAALSVWAALGLAVTNLAPSWIAVCAVLATAALPIAMKRAVDVVETRFTAGRSARISTVLKNLCKVVSEASLAQLYLVMMQTMAIWAMLAVSAQAALIGVGAADADGGAALGIAAVAMGGGSIAFASPVNGIANIGPFEAAFAASAALAGVTVEKGVAAAALVHLCAVLTAVGAAMGAQLLVWRRTAVVSTEDA